MAYYINLLQGSIGEEIAKFTDTNPCGGSCPPEKQVRNVRNARYVTAARIPPVA